MIGEISVVPQADGPARELIAKLLAAIAWIVGTPPNLLHVPGIPAPPNQGGQHAD